MAVDLVDVVIVAPNMLWHGKTLTYEVPLGFSPHQRRIGAPVIVPVGQRFYYGAIVSHEGKYRGPGMKPIYSIGKTYDLDAAYPDWRNFLEDVVEADYNI